MSTERAVDSPDLHVRLCLSRWNITIMGRVSSSSCFGTRALASRYWHSVELQASLTPAFQGLVVAQLRVLMVSPTFWLRCLVDLLVTSNFEMTQPLTIVR